MRVPHQNPSRRQKSRWVIRYVAMLAFTALAGCGGEEKSQSTIQVTGPTMGTTYSILIWSDGGLGEEAAVNVKDAADSELKRINAMMSTYIDDSEITRFNNQQSTDWFAVSPEMVDVVDSSLEISRATSGAFDITVGPLVELWGFGAAGRRQTPPSQDDIARVRQYVGYSKLEARRTPPALRKSAAKLRIDLSAIAKGYAVDRLVETLESKGYEHFLIEVGGELAARGSKGGKLWKVGIEAPDVETRRIQAAAPLTNQSMATSGDYRNFFEHEGQRFSHTLDPTTAAPVKHTLTSVTVIADSCMKADAWATALLVTGPQKARSLGSDHKLKTLLMKYEGPRLVQIKSKDFPEVEEQSQSTFAIVIATGVVFALAIVGMAIGVIVSNRKLRGSCGGLSGESESPCSLCTVPAEQCREKQQQAAVETGVAAASSE